MKRSYFITSSDGTRLRVSEYGRSEGYPVIFMHGLCQSHACWSKQFKSSLSERYRIVAFDLRGHGMSDKPCEKEAYTEKGYWADDLKTLIDSLGSEKPFIVCWSYSGYVLCDYIEKYGDNEISGINFVAATVKLTQKFDMLGPGLLRNFRDMVSYDLEKNMEATKRFVRDLFYNKPDDHYLSFLVSCNMMVPNHVREALTERELDYKDILKKISVPVLISCGTRDRIVRNSMSGYIAMLIRGSLLSEYSDTGHSIFYERPERFISELDSFISRLRSG